MVGRLGWAGLAEVRLVARSRAGGRGGPALAMGCHWKSTSGKAEGEAVSAVCTSLGLHVPPSCCRFGCGCVWEGAAAIDDGPVAMEAGH